MRRISEPLWLREKVKPGRAAEREVAKVSFQAPDCRLRLVKPEREPLTS